jgi:hypothetical protein
MKWRRLGLGLLVLLWLGGCASSGGPGHGDTLSVGQREEELVARKGQPQEVQPEPGGGKIYVYTAGNLDQVAVMGGGAWVKPDQVYYWLNNQGVITRVVRYPYGKRKFLFPSREKPTMVAAQVPTSPAVAPAPPASPAAVKAPEPSPPPPAPVPPAPAPLASPPPEQVAQPKPKPAPAAEPMPAPTPRETARAPAVPVAPPPRSNMAAATRLELYMSREDVQGLLGPPERTEGFRAGGRAVIIWFYLLENRQGRRVATPLVFEEGRLTGWGENHYRRRLREVSR